MRSLFCWIQSLLNVEYGRIIASFFIISPLLKRDPSGGFSMCRKIVLALVVLYPCLLISTVTAQDSAKPSQSAQTEAAAQPQSGSNSTAPKGFVLEDGTPVKLRINRTISSGDAHVGDTVDFEVLDEVNVNGMLVIPKGGLAFATVTEAQGKRRMARGGKLDINIDYVKLVSGEKAALRAVKDLKGGGHTGAMVGGMVATSLVFFPAAPFFLFMHGKDITIPKGTEVTAYANGDMKLELARFQSAPALQQTSGNLAGANSSSAKLQVESNPSGADIEVDGSFVGNTPSEVQVAEGDHIVAVKKVGFNSWERKMKVSNGSNLHLSAELERVAAQ